MNRRRAWAAPGRVGASLAWLGIVSSSGLAAASGRPYAGPQAVQSPVHRRPVETVREPQGPDGPEEPKAVAEATAAGTDVKPEPEPDLSTQRRWRLPSDGPLQPWIRYSVLSEWYRENYNTFDSDHGFVAFVHRFNAGMDARLEGVTLGGQIRLDGQNVFFPSGQDCSELDCVPLDDDVRLERATFRAESRHVSGAVGDYNVNFGRGVALSIRKVDEIGIDATVKGGRLDINTRPFRATAIAGFVNRQNTDFATRQLLPDPGFPGQSYTFAPDGCDVSAGLDQDIGGRYWTYCSDLAAGGRVESTLPGRVDVGAHYVYLDFGDELSQVTEGVDEYLHLIGGDVSRTRIGGLWDVYLGGTAVIRNPNLQGTVLADDAYTGYGLYLSNVLTFGATTVLFEAKHYDEYLVALSQNALLQYSEAPTLEREDQQVPGNVNATGGRVRMDHLLRDLGLTLYGNLMSYAYSQQRVDSAFGDDGLVAVHGYGGAIWRRPDADLVLQISAGYRHEQWLEQLGGRLKRRFPHAEVALTIPLGQTRGLVHSLSLRADGRYERYQTLGSSDDFYRGLIVLGYALAPWLRVSLLGGIDTERATPPGEPGLTDERCVRDEGGGERPGEGSQCRPHLWPGAEVRVNFFDASFVRVFAGRQMGGRICVNGSCRTVPDFEGVRAELTVAF